MAAVDGLGRLGLGVGLGARASLGHFWQRGTTYAVAVSGPSYLLPRTMYSVTGLVHAYVHVLMYVGTCERLAFRGKSISKLENLAKYRCVYIST